MHDLVIEHMCELRVSQTQSPQSQIGGCIGDGSKNELNRFNQLMNEDLSEIVVSVLWTDDVDKIGVLLFFHLDFFITHHLLFSRSVQKSMSFFIIRLVDVLDMTSLSSFFFHSRLEDEWFG